jgi:fibronectin-binding autotransporter adhesin
VTLVRDGTGTVKLWAAGSYTGGTFLNGGATTTDVASLAYFGAGAVTLQQGGTLTLGATGATTYNNGGAYGAPAYTVINRANLVLPTTTTGTVATMNSQGDTFSIGAGSQIRGINNPTANPNKGLLSLTRVAGAGSITAGGQIVLAEDAIVAHSDFSNDNNNGKAGYTIANLGATPDLYFGLYNDFNAGSSQRLDIGAGTPWKGVSSAMEGQKRFYQGTLNVNPGTTDFYLQGISTLGGGTVNLYLGNTTTTGMTIAVGGPATAHVLGSVLLDSDRSTFSSDLTFRVEPGATLTLNQAKAMGGSNAAIAATTSPVIAGVGGRVSLGNAAAVNGPLTVEGGGVLFNNNMGALTGTGTITFQPGGIYDINNVNALSGAQTIVRVPGMIYRINAGDNPTIPNLNLNTAASAAGIYELYNNNDNNENYTPTAPTTWQPNVWLDGGVITHDAQARSWYSTRNGYMAIGPAGAAFAGTTAPGWSGYPALRVDEDFDLGANTLTIGSTDSIDGLPKYGPVELRSAGNRATAGSKIVVLGNGAAGAYLRLRYDPNTNQGTRTWVDVIPNQSRLEIQAGATFDTYATIDVIGSIVGGGIIRNSADQVQPMFVGSDGTDAVFSGAFQAANQGLQIIKVGGGNWTLTGDSSAWTNNALAVASGTVTLKDSGKVKFGTLTNQYFGVTNVYQGATLTFDETGSVNGADRLAGQHLQMDGGALVLKGSTTADTTDALAGQLLLRWDSEVIDIQPSAGRTATLSFTNATASTISWGATGLIKGRNLGDGTGAMLKFNAPPAYTGQTATSGANKAIWPALLASPNTDGSSPMFATLDAANGIRPLALTWNGTAVNEYVTALTSGMAGTPNVVLDATAATGLNNTAINSLTLANSSSVGINAGQTLTLDSGGVLVTADAGITGGTLNAGAAGRQYLFHVLNPAVGGTTLTLTSTLATDTDFVKAGGGTVLFNTRQLRNATKWRSTIRGTVVK